MIHDPDTTDWSIVAHRGLEQFAIDIGDGYGGRVLDLDVRVLSAPLPSPEIFAGVEWTFVPVYDFDPALLAEVDVIELDEVGQAYYEQQRRRAGAAPSDAPLVPEGV